MIRDSRWYDVEPVQPLDRDLTGDHVLFISHEASLTGAPTMLLHLLRWLRANSSLAFEVVCVKGGPLVSEFASLAPTVTLDRTSMRWFIAGDHIASSGSRLYPHALTRLLARIASTLRRWAIRRRLGDLSRFSLIYANSAVSALCFPSLSRPRPPVVTHVHELAHTLRHYLPHGALEAMLSTTDHFIACSDAVRRVLTSEHDVSEDRISLCYEPVVGANLKTIGDRYARSDVLDELNIPRDAMVVGATGTIDWRKGTDLFGLVAASVRAKFGPAPVFFVWVGECRLTSGDHTFRYDFDKLGLGDRLRLVDTVPDPHRYFSVFDVLALTSREDPFPLAALEASAMAIPVVAFDSGGVKEMLPPEVDAVVPYADIEAMATGVVELLRDPELSAKRGVFASEWVIDRYGIDVIGPQILDVIETNMN